MPRFAVLNSTRQTMIAAQVDFADTPNARRIGLFKHDRLKLGQGLFIPGRSWIPFMAIHTIGMKFSIDVIYLDKNQCVMRLETIHPNRIAWARGARGVLEVAEGAIAESQTRLGDKIEMSELQTTNQGGENKNEDSPIPSII